MLNGTRNVLVLLLMSAPASALAQTGAGTPDDATAQTEAYVVRPISVSCGDMQFGRLAPLRNEIATVTVVAGGGLTNLVDPKGISVPGAREIATPSDCTVDGEFNLSYSVTLPASAELSNGAGGTMILDNFKISPELDGNPLDRRLATNLGGGAGRNGFLVGATLNVGANQAPGLYTGPFVVTVQYN